ncbi:MAG TPA: SufBD protein [Clostridia bacterium]|nr:SufBD protein [Clostridia bacterium]
MEANIGILAEQLFSRDNNAAYRALQTLLVLSAESDDVYAHFDRFAGMLRGPNSYIRSRGMFLVAANARWDEENKTERALGDCLALLRDEKPITVRQCVKLLPQIAAAKPELRGRILEALRSADPSGYADTMRPLIAKDIAAAIKEIEG